MRDKKMTIIVTGGAGFIGSNFVFHMLDKYPNYRIVCVDKLTYAGNLSTLAPVMDNPNFRFCKIDICDREAIYQLFEEEHPDMVVNFAAESHVDRSIENPEVFLDTIRYQRMKYTEIFHWTDRIFSLRKRHRSIQAPRTAVPKQEQTFWCLLTTEPTGFR